MDAQSRQAILNRAAESHQQYERVITLLPKTAPPSLRAQFARCAISLGLEHHAAIFRLIQVDSYGSAAALLRPLLEANTSAFWLMYIADCPYIRSLPTTKNAGRAADIPQLDKMAPPLARIFPPIQTLVDGLRNNGPASWLHKYTHGGMPQLLRRGDGWSVGDVMHLLLAADIFSILGPCLETVIEPNPGMTAYAFPRRDAIGEEMVRVFGIPTPPEQPHALPAVLDDGCGMPFSM